jgi:hypothetical protein
LIPADDTTMFISSNSEAPVTQCEAVPHLRRTETSTTPL